MSELLIELKELRARSNKLTSQWNQELGNAKEIGNNKEILENLKSELEEAKRTGQLERAGELTYSVIPKLEALISKAEKKREKNGKNFFGKKKKFSV